MSASPTTTPALSAGNALASGEMQNPIQVETSDDGKTFDVGIPLAGSGADDVSNHALATLRRFFRLQSAAASHF